MPGAAKKRVLLYELNEVPWEIVDKYVEARPKSNLAAVLRRSLCQTTVNDDPNHLSPWRTWPTFHKAMYSDDHNSFELGQDPETFRGKALWDVAEESGLSIGVFGALQSWPPHRPRYGGFYVPDTFSKTPETFPPSLTRFQEFNLSMTRELGFSSDARLSPKGMALTGLDVVTKGLTPWSTRWIVRQLVRERREPRYKACRSIAQALPAFDLFWRLYRKAEPDLGIFFTNHVAGMMHRFWGDSVREYAEENDYDPDEIFGRFVDDGMDVFDHQLGRIMRFLDGRQDTVLIVASSMGQAGIPYHHIGETYVLKDAKRLAQTLQLGDVEPGMAMYPASAIELRDHDVAERAAKTLGQVQCNDEALFADIRVEGRTVTFKVHIPGEGEEIAREVRHGNSKDPTPHISGNLEDVGIEVAERLGGGNTAYHIPEGILFTYGPGISPDQSRERISVLEAAPEILGLLGLEQERHKLSAAAPAAGVAR